MLCQNATELEGAQPCKIKWNVGFDCTYNFVKATKAKNRVQASYHMTGLFQEGRFPELNSLCRDTTCTLLFQKFSVPESKIIFESIFFWNKKVLVLTTPIPLPDMFTMSVKFLPQYHFRLWIHFFFGIKKYDGKRTYCSLTNPNTTSRDVHHACES